MSKIWRDIELTWEGESYTIRPTMAFINAMEQGDGMSLAAMFTRIHNRDMPSGLACELIARALRYAGAKDVTAESVYMATGGISSDVVDLAIAILVGCMPADKEPSKKKSAK